MTLLQHQELLIVKGVGPTPGDTASAEQPLTVVNLMDADAGFSLKSWTPNIPSLKSSGIWADSSITDGRTLIAGVNTNVIETIVITLTGANVSDYAMQFAKLQRIVQDARNFWDNTQQFEPVYLRWWANCAPGPQFSLIYNIDLDVEFDDSTIASAVITMKIEREYRWRGRVRPGGNPKEWAIGNTFSATNANLSVPDSTFGPQNLVYNTSLLNRTEYTVGNKQSYVSKNFVDITASQIPGDLPALTCIMVQFSNAATPANWTMFVSRKSTPSNQLVSGVDVYLQSMMLNAGDMTLGAATTLAADTGAPLTQAGGVQRRAVFTPVDNLDAARLTVASRALLNHRGTYAIFCRCRQAAGAAGDISMHIVAGQQSPFLTSNLLTSVNPTLQAGVGNTVYWPVTYLGTIQFPTKTPSPVLLNGKGNQYSATDWSLVLNAKRNAGTTAVLYVADIILIPIDEPSVMISTQTNGLTQLAALDGTGYFQHGGTEYYVDTASVAGTPSQWSGQPIDLLPGVNQRLYFFSMFSDFTSDVINSGAIVGVNIVPCWSGIRDV